MTPSSDALSSLRLTQQDGPCAALSHLPTHALPIKLCRHNCTDVGPFACCTTVLLFTWFSSDRLEIASWSLCDCKERSPQETPLTCFFHSVWEPSPSQETLKDILKGDALYLFQTHMPPPRHKGLLSITKLSDFFFFFFFLVALYVWDLRSWLGD